MKLTTALLTASMLLAGIVVATAPTASAACVPGTEDFCTPPVEVACTPVRDCIPECWMNSDGDIICRMKPILRA